MTTATAMNNLLDWAYDRVLLGAPGVDKATSLALRYNNPLMTLEQQVDALIKRQKLLAGSSGFLTGLGGFLSLPLAIPANLASVVFIQLRMISAIAHMGGYDLDDRKVRTLIYTCMAGNYAKNILQEVGIRVGQRVTGRLISSISESSIVAINQKIGFALVAKTGGKGFFNISKAVPLAGGIIGGTFDVLTTGLIGRIARKTFIEVAE